MAAPSYNLSALAVLIADKNAHMRRIMRSILRELNIRLVTEAATPEDVLAMLTSKPFDLAFIEWAPDFDGNASIRQLRRHAQAASRSIPGAPDNMAPGAPSVPARAGRSCLTAVSTNRSRRCLS